MIVSCEENILKGTKVNRAFGAFPDEPSGRQARTQGRRRLGWEVAGHLVPSGDRRTWGAEGEDASDTKNVPCRHVDFGRGNVRGGDPELGI